jgi:hypothetical protein
MTLGALTLRVRGRTGEGRIGDDDSAPDWKMLLSSQPLSSVIYNKADDQTRFLSKEIHLTCETRRACEPAASDLMTG